MEKAEDKQITFEGNNMEVKQDSEKEDEKEENSEPLYF